MVGNSGITGGLGKRDKMKEKKRKRVKGEGGGEEVGGKGKYKMRENYSLDLASHTDYG